jgi:hypothetical protein
MALPNPGSAPQTTPPIDNSIREAISTGIKAGLLTTQSRIFSKVPAILGGGIFRERAEEKRRELYASQGRDVNTGRKLTKDEIEERERRKMSQDAMGEINENVDLIRILLEKNFGKPSATALPALGLAGMPNILAPKKDTTPYELADDSGGINLAQEEQKIEQQKADKEVQLEVQEKDHSFTEKLFEKYFGKSNIDRSKAGAEAKAGGGLLSKLAGVIDTFADLKTLGIIGKGSRLGKIGSAVARGGMGLVSGAGRMIGGVARGAVNLGVKAAGAVTGAVSGAAKAGGGFLSNMWGSVKSMGGKIADTAGKFKGLLGGVGGLGKMVIGAIGPAIETFLSYQDISNIKSDPNLSAQEKKDQIGKRIGKAIGSILGGIGSMALLGPVGPVVTTALDAFGIGPGALGEYLAEKLGGEKIYDIASSVPLLGDFVKVDETAPPTKETLPAEGQLQTNTPFESPEDYNKFGMNSGMQTPALTPTQVATAVPNMTPTSAATLGNLQVESSALKSAPQIMPPVVVPTNNAVVNNTNNVSWMSSLTPTRSGADLDEKVFKLGLAF